ncbi:hypothetical protein M6B38_193710 [Iris pallida]|uniref:Uncharacterized protein n=1 Tax=Iris pallida TaxID=29817 RepID=A0AAX6EDT6_IRIPA|nr:hypothetical protein M6B38_193710 [Iris pallida]
MSIHYVPFKQKLIYSREQFQVDERSPGRPRCLTIAFLNVCIPSMDAEILLDVMNSWSSAN